MLDRDTGDDPLPLAVSDAGPLIHLAQINGLFLLEKLFKVVLITSGVKREVVDMGVEHGYDDALIVRRAIDEGWVTIKDITEMMASTAERLAEDENISRSDAQTLLLARENDVESILIDDKILSDLAKMHGFKVWNTWTILLEALRNGFIEISEIESAINELADRRHKLKAEQAAKILEAARLIVSDREERRQRL
jgi:predicted nucleic acid-binding protein